MLNVGDYLGDSVWLFLIGFACLGFSGIASGDNNECSAEIYSSFKKSRSAALLGDSELYSRSVNRRAFRERAVESYEHNKPTGEKLITEDNISAITDKNVDGFKKILLDIKFVKAYASICNRGKAELFLAIQKNDSELSEVVLSFTKISDTWRLDGVLLSDYSFVARKNYDELELDIVVVNDMLPLRERGKGH